MLIIIQTLKIKNGLFRSTEKMEEEARNIYQRLVKFYEDTHYKKNTMIRIGVTYNPTLNPIDLQFFIVFRNDDLEFENEREIFSTRLERIISELELYSTYHSSRCYAWSSSAEIPTAYLHDSNKLPIDQVDNFGFSIVSTFFSAKMDANLATREADEEFYEWGSGTRFFICRRAKEKHLYQAQLIDHTQKLYDWLNGISGTEESPNPRLDEVDHRDQKTTTTSRIKSCAIKLSSQGFTISIPGLEFSSSEHVSTIILQKLKSLGIDFYEVAGRMWSSHGCTHRAIGYTSVGYLNEYFLSELPFPDEIPDEYKCPLSMRLMDSPVELNKLAVEKAAVEDSLLHSPEDPYTRKPLHLSECKSLPDLSTKIEEFVKSQVKKCFTLGNESFHSKKYDESIRLFSGVLNAYGYDIAHLATYTEEGKQIVRANAYNLLRNIMHSYLGKGDFKNAIKLLIIILIKQEDFALDDEQIGENHHDLSECFRKSGIRFGALNHLHISEDYFRKANLANNEVSVQLLPFFKNDNRLTNLVLQYLENPASHRRP